MRDLSELYQEHWTFLCKLLTARFGSGPPEPRDIAQEAFIKLSDKLQDGEQIHNPRSFLAKTAQNLVIDYHRSPKNRAPSDSELIAAEREESTDVSSPETVLLSRETLGTVADVLMRLSERDRSFVLMNRLEGLSYTEIARRAGMSRSGVQLIITQALQKCLKEAALGGDDLRSSR